MIMKIELDPPNGITGFPFAMPAEAIKEASAELGSVQVQDEGSSELFRSMKVLALHPQFELVLHLQDGETLSAAEVWIPRPGPEEITVTFRGIDVFRTPALELVQLLREMDLTVHHHDHDHWLVPGLSLGLTRTTGHEVPLDTDGEPLYFQAVLAAPTDYYDYLLQLDQL